MADEPAGVYLPTSAPDTYESTQLANAGWYEEGQHGGALAALIAGHLDAIPSLVPMAVTRFSLDLFRVVPLVTLRLDVEIIREGKRIQVIQVKVMADQVELSRAVVQRIRLDDVGLPSNVVEPLTPFPHPEFADTTEGESWIHGPDDKIMFHRDAIEIAGADAGYYKAGPGRLWMRVTRPVIAGTALTPLQRLVIAADFPNGVSRLTTDPQWQFMNPDLTVNINRLPRGEWVALQAESVYSPDGRGVATGTLWDEQTYLGRTTQTLYLDHIGRDT